MSPKREFLLVGLVIGLTCFFVPVLQSGNLGIPWVERFIGIFGFAANNLLLSIVLMGMVYVIFGIVPFSIYYFLRKRNSRNLFFSFLFFSFGLLMSYAAILLTLFFAFRFSNPTVL